MSNRCIERVGGLAAMAVIGMGTSSYRIGTVTGSTANRPRKRGRSLYSIDGWTKGATSACNLAVSSLLNTKTALPVRDTSVGLIPQVSARYAARRVLVVGSMA